MLKKIVEHIFVGAAIGFFVTTACLWAFGAYEASGFEVMRFYTIWLAASVLFGIISLIYDTNIPFPVNLIIHFLGCAAVTFAASWLMGIFENMLGQWFISVFPLFVIIYVIIGALITALTRHYTRQINEKIKNSK